MSEPNSITQVGGQVEFVESRLAAASHLVLARREMFLSHPDDIETNHKFRVSIRTLRGLVSFLEPWQKKKQGACVQRRLKKVVKVTSRLRELDVLAAMGSQLQPENGELAEFLAGQASAERERVRRAIADERTYAKLVKVECDLNDVIWKDELDSHRARVHFDNLVEGLQRDLDDLDVDDYELVHSVRKRAKQIRYVAEQFEELLGEDVIAIAKHMKSQQDHLGALCDAKVNRELVESFLACDGMSPTLATSLRDLVNLP